MTKKIYVFLFNGFSDWEIAYFAPEIMKHEEFDLIYFTQNGSSVVSMGGLRIMADFSLQEINPDMVDMLILPGGTAWEKDKNNFIAPLVKELVTKGKPIAAICAATTFLAKNGFLSRVKHTSNDLYYLKTIASEYTGETNYIDALAVTDENIITAKAVAPVEFAREIFTFLNPGDSKEIEKWFQLFKHGIRSE